MADLSFKNCSLGPKTVIFGPKKPWNAFKTAKRRETVGMCHVRLDFPVSTSSLPPSNSMICPGNGPKRPPQAPNADNHKPRIGHIFGYMAQNAIPRAPIPPEPPTFCGFHPSNLPKRTPTPQYLGPLGCGKLQAQAQTGGCPNGSTGSSRGKTTTFLKNDPRPCATLKQVFLDGFELVVAHFGPPKIPKCLENGLFWDQKWVNNGSKTHFSRPHPRPFGVHKRVK